MKGLIQRVTSASVSVNTEVVGEIQSGILLFIGVEKDDSDQQIEKMARKVFNYRIFADQDGRMNKSLSDIQGELLVVSQFTLVADTAKGNRPGFSKGATPEHGEFIYKSFVQHINSEYWKCQTGIFGADMAVSLLNDGPVTFWIET
ncbi:D-aminoacyl-tRNA deacylase [Glaciecola sp. MF2-115]|uniref:D-aminoacyl-tRNA deacylase n=1 Tax=Glaciecola sp. MF2-115 TaxID=3384827 RepID=UPI0039A11519